MGMSGVGQPVKLTVLDLRRGQAAGNTMTTPRRWRSTTLIRRFAMRQYHPECLIFAIELSGNLSARKDALTRWRIGKTSGNRALMMTLLCKGLILWKMLGAKLSGIVRRNRLRIRARLRHERKIDCPPSIGPVFVGRRVACIFWHGFE